MRSYRLATIASCAALAAVLSACTSRPVVVNSYPQVAAPAATVVTVPVAAAEYGRITSIESPVAGAYRITIQSETAGWRTLDLPATGDLRIGDRVRIENGTITRA
ncbi:hypothetical protein [Caenimonas aquaedulcis]|uniref:Uncharacterized protein n=1 Tax=Caenimonas aquaedulcis TaxID=2793270 RepID=A0A931H2W4_9BURK|nr:hypothetical protein [Caenimonas aquaedulcis]MBG9387576.1 hypothetical protein [Caenimonas aquaedulcis]